MIQKGYMTDSFFVLLIFCKVDISDVFPTDFDHFVVKSQAHYITRAILKLIIIFICISELKSKSLLAFWRSAEIFLYIANKVFFLNLILFSISFFLFGGLLFMSVLLSSVHNFHFKWEVRNPEFPVSLSRKAYTAVSLPASSSSFKAIPRLSYAR